MKEILSTVRYLMREPGTAWWIRINLLFAVLVVLALLVWGYAAAYRAAVDDNIDQYRSYLAAHLKQAELYRSYRSDSGRVKSAIKAMRERYRQPTMVAAIEGLAKHNKVKVLGQKYRSTRDRGGDKSWQVDITATGGYPGLKAFMHGLGGLRGKAVIEKIRLSPMQQEGQLELQVQITIFQIPS